MIIKPRVRGFICLTAHPTGCAAHVREQIGYVKGRGPVEGGPRNVLVLGASIETGNPGPLINFVMNASFESRVPITIVPGNLTDEQIDDLI